MSSLSEKEYLLINYEEDDKQYKIFSTDFRKIVKYCENECMGIKFLINANFLRKLVKNLLSLNFSPPFTIKDFLSEKSKQGLKESGVYASMKKIFGTDNLKLVVRLVIKQTYNFLHKI